MRNTLNTEGFRLAVLYPGAFVAGYLLTQWAAPQVPLALALAAGWILCLINNPIVVGIWLFTAVVNVAAILFVRRHDGLED